MERSKAALKMAMEKERAAIDDAAHSAWHGKVTEGSIRAMGQTQAEKDMINERWAIMRAT